MIYRFLPFFLFLHFGWQQVYSQISGGVDTSDLISAFEPNSILKKTLIAEGSLFDTNLFIYDSANDGWSKFILRKKTSHEGILLLVKGDSIIKKQINTNSIFEIIKYCRFSKPIYNQQQKKAKRLDPKIRVWLNPGDYSHLTFIISDHKSYVLKLNPLQTFEIDDNEEKLFREVSKVLNEEIP